MALTQEAYDWLMTVAREMDIPEDNIEEVTTMSMDEMLRSAKVPKEFEEYASVLSIQSHLNRSEITMPDRLQSYYEDKILASVPGDMVVFKDEEEQRDLISLFFPPSWQGHGTPIDIIKEGTIPLMDMHIRVPIQFLETELQCDFRIVIFPDYMERLEAENEVSIIGSWLLYPRHDRAKRVLFGLLQVIPDSDFICDSGLLGWIGKKPDRFLQNCISMAGPYQYHIMLAPYMMAWYCIQLTLLNPPTCEVYQKLREETQEAVKTTYVFRRRNKIKYVKKIYLNPKKNLVPKDNLEGGDKYKKKCPYWRVIGHWRTYKKDGKRIWINSYWKGRHRNFIPKHTIDGMRERIVVKSQEEGGDT